MRALLLFLANHVHFNRLDLNLLGLDLFILVLHELRGDNLLQNTEHRRGCPEQKNARRGAPAKPQHEQGHDAHHDHGLRLLRAVRAHLLKQGRQEGAESEQQKQDAVRQERHEALIEHGGRRGKQRRQNVVERIRHAFGAGAHFLEHLEEGNEDRHLEKQGQAAGNGVEPDLGVNLLHFLSLTLLIVGVLFLDLLNARRELLHSIRRADLLLHKGEQDKTENERYEDDRQTPVGNEAVSSIDAPEYGVFKRVPHVYLCPLGSGANY